MILYFLGFNTPLQSDLEAFLATPALRGANVSCCVRDASGNVLLEHNSEARMIPASNQKLISVAFALAKLGPSFQPTIQFWITDKRLTIASDGYCSLKYEDLLRAKKTLGLKARVPVELIESFSPGIPPSWEWDDLRNKYAPSITALSCDRASFELWAKNGGLELRPDSYGVQLRTVSSGTGIDYDPRLGIVLYHGKVPADEQRLDTLAVPKPSEAVASVFGWVTKRSSVRPIGPPTLELTGDQLQETAKECLSKSDNFLAEQLLLMAAQSQGSLGNDPYKTASKVVVEWLVQQVGCEADDFKVLDGSGLSRHNLLTTRGLTRLLNYCKHQSFAASWAQALAVPGYGTLKGRLAGSAFWGKTGTLDSVAALSGYLRDLENNQLSLSILVNNFVAKPNDVRNATDGFVRKLEISLGGRCIPAKSAVLQVRS